jgi:hypothetical protein
MYASNAIMERLIFSYRGEEIRNVSLLAQGYGFISSSHQYSPTDLYFLLTVLVSNQKTVVLEKCDREMLSLLEQLLVDYPEARLIMVKDEKLSQIGPGLYRMLHDVQDALLLIISEPFLMRRFLHQRIQRCNILFKGQEKLPVQTVRFVGVGPTPELLTLKVIATIERTEHVVLFDRTLENIVTDINFSGYKYVLPFVYEDFASNLLTLNLMLATLQAGGITEVTVLIEGNPEIYDVAEGLSMVRRRFVYEVSMPLVILGCEWLEREYGVHFIQPGYILTSGFNVRQGITTAELQKELMTYLETDLTFMVMEMYCGDIPLVLAQLRQAKRGKSVFILMNMFSPQQRVYFLPFCSLHQADWIERIKGKFTTIVVIDDERLPPDSPQYDRLVQMVGLTRKFD